MRFQKGKRRGPRMPGVCFLHAQLEASNKDLLNSSSGYISTVETKPCEQGNVKNHESSAIVQNNTCSQGNQINTVVEMTPIGS